MDHDVMVRRFVEGYAEALSTGDLQGIVQAWGVPGIVIADAGVQPVAAAGEVEAFFASAIERYGLSGITAARPAVEQVERLGEHLFSVDVLWVNVDEQGHEVTRESWRYVLKRSGAGAPRIHAAVMKADVE